MAPERSTLMDPA